MRPYSGTEWRVWYEGYLQNRCSAFWVMYVDAIGDDIMMDSCACEPLHRANSPQRDITYTTTWAKLEPVVKILTG